MLRDEVPRTALVLYFFADPQDARAREDLAFLGRQVADLKELTAGVLAVCPAKLEALKAVQRELSLPFPLLTDDRGFSGLYGLAADEPTTETEAGAEATATPSSALYIVDRRQVVRWAAAPAPAAAEAWGAMRGVLKGLGSSTANYPRRITNRLVDLWVNQTGGLRKKRA